MPFLRFTRDKRGYETTVLLHAFREGGRAQPRILYWFRGPVAAKVGRPAIDEEAIRVIEERHPDLSFDWGRILASRAVAPLDEPPRSRSRAAGASPPARAEAAQAGESGDRVQGDEAVVRAKRGRERGRSRRRGRTAPETGAVADAETPAARAAEGAEAQRAAEEMFSPEDLTRLRGRHAALLARIDRSVAEPAAAQGLREAAEALNPDSWLTREDVERALEHYERTYRALLDALKSGGQSSH